MRQSTAQAAPRGVLTANQSVLNQSDFKGAAQKLSAAQLPFNYLQPQSQSVATKENVQHHPNFFIGKLLNQGGAKVSARETSNGRKGEHAVPTRLKTSA